MATPPRKTNGGRESAAYRSKRKTTYLDDDTESVNLLFRLRISPLLLGLVLGIGLSFAVSRFEEVLAANIAVSFFIPLIVYLAAAVGAQTQSVYTRDLKTGKANFKTYLVKETKLGVMLGVLFSILVGIAVRLWLNAAEVAWAVALATFVAVSVAPLVALMVTQLFQEEHRDPAAGAGPIATVIQDALSIVIYGLIASAILL